MKFSNILLFVVLLSCAISAYPSEVIKYDTGYHATDIFNTNAKTLGTSKLTVKLLDSTQYCLTDCYSIYNVCSDTVVTSDDLNTLFYNQIGNQISVKYKILQEEDVVIPRTCYNHKLTYNVSKVSTIVNNETMEKKDIDVTTVIDDKTPYDCSYTIKQFNIPTKFIGCNNVKIEVIKGVRDNVDNVLKVYSTSFPEYDWFNVTWVSKRTMNITCNQCNNNSFSFNFTLPFTINEEIRITTNGSGTELECGGIWKMKNVTTETYIANCTLANGTTAISVYYNNQTAVTDIRNATKGCLVGDEFSGGTLDTSIWTESTNGMTLNRFFNNGLMNMNSSKGGGAGSYAYLQSNIILGNKTVLKVMTKPEAENAGGYGTSIGFNFYDGTGTSDFSGMFRVENTNFYIGGTNSGGNDVTPKIIGGSNVWTLGNITWVSDTNGQIIYRNGFKNPSREPLSMSRIKIGSMGGLGATEYSNDTYDWLCAFNLMNSTGYNATFSDFSPEVNFSITYSTPVINFLTIAPLYPHTLDNINVTYLYNHTIGNISNITVQWYVNATQVFKETYLNVPNNTNITSNLSHLFSNQSDVVLAWVFANDSINTTNISSASVTILNTFPVISNASITPVSAFRTTPYLYASFQILHNDSDIVYVNVSWLNNGTAIYNETLSGTNGTYVSTSLSNSNYTKGCIVNVSAYGYDNYNQSNASYSTNLVTILNSPPAISFGSFAQSIINVSINTTLTDADNDLINYTFLWYVNSVYKANTSGTNQINGTMIYYNISNLHYIVGDTILFVARANDSSNLTNSSTSYVVISVSTSSNFTGNLSNYSDYSIENMQQYIQDFFTDWLGYILGIMCYAFAYAYTYKISQTLIAGGVGLTAIFFMTGNLVFFAASLLSIVVGYAIKYIAG